MSIMITGATGFIGSHLTTSLLRIGKDVVAVDDWSGGLTFRNNLGDYLPMNAVGTYGLGKLQQARVAVGAHEHERMVELMQQHRVTTLVHCAANAREGASQFQPYSVTSRNMLAYSSVLSAAVACGIKNVILFSTMAVYGHGDYQPPFDETIPKRPVDVYGINKAAMEDMTHIMAKVHGFNYCIVRPHNVFGERQALHDKMRNVVAIFMNRIMREEPLFIYGDGRQVRAFSYIEDSLPAFLSAILNCREFHGEVFNIGGMKPVTVLYLSEAVKNAMGVPNWPVVHVKDRPQEVKSAYSTYKKSVECLGYSENVGWESGIAKMAEWALRQGPREWMTTDRLEIINEHTPEPWLT